MDAKTEQKIEKFIEDYKKVEEEYKSFANCIHIILEQILKNNGFKDRYQQIQFRSKDVVSLRKKLIEKPELLGVGVHDLAGCRVIFYLEEDVGKFEELIRGEFRRQSVEYKRSPDSYNACHIIVKLDDARVKLVEYSRFKDLVCEIQLTTSLFHVWSEINHDIIYKPDPEVKAFSLKDSKFLEKKLKEVMSKYIQKASYNFSFIVGEFERLKQGKQILNIDTLKEISLSDSNEEMLDYLNKLNDFVGYYRPPSDFDFLIHLRPLWQKAEQNDNISPKKLFQDIILSSFKLIQRTKYWDYENTIKLCIELSSDSEFKKYYLETLKDYAKYDLNAVEKIGYDTQKILIAQLNKLDIEDDQVKECVVAICKSLLSNDIKGFGHEQLDTLTIRMGPIPVNNDLKSIRRSAIELLLKILEKEKDCGNIEQIIEAVSVSLSPTHRGKASKELRAVMYENSCLVLSFLDDKYARLDNCTKRAIEKHIFWRTDPEFEAITEVGSIKRKLYGDKGYIRYKTFIGYDLDYGRDYKKTGEERARRINEFVAQISQKNLQEWIEYLTKEILIDYINQYPGQYHNVYSFLRILATKKPNEGKKLLEIKELSVFKVSILIGLLESDKKDEITDEIKRKIGHGEDLLEIAEAFFSVNEIGAGLLPFLAEKILTTNEPLATVSLLKTVSNQYPKNKNLKTIFIKIIEKLTELKFYGWPERISPWSEQVTKDMSVSEYDSILDNLLHKKEIEYHTEQILLPLAQKDAGRVIRFFFDRIKQRESGENLIDAIPYNLQLLKDPLTKQSGIVIPEIIKWFGTDNHMYNWLASHLLNTIFPKIEREFQKGLIEMIRSKDETKLDYVLRILDEYEGDTDVLGPVKEIIKTFKMTSELKVRLFRILSNTGGVIGEYGMVEKYETKIKDIESWKRDGDENISSFAKAYVEYLENCIKYEKARVERNIDLRKNEFDRSKSV